MPVESFSYISSLNTSNPAVADGLEQGDDHLRGIKLAIKQSFPNIDGATDCTPAQLTGMGATLAQPGDVKMQAHGTIPTGWLECDGSAVSRTTYAALFAAIGTVWGAGNGSTTFNVPDMRDRYPRGRSATRTVGTTLAQSIQSHTHTASTTGTASGTSDSSGQGHTHGFSATTSSDGAHSHTVDDGTSAFLSAGAFATETIQGSTTSTSTDGAHTHTVSGTTDSASSAHTHTFTGTLSATTTVDATGDTETRPASAVLVFIIKT